MVTATGSAFRRSSPPFEDRVQGMRFDAVVAEFWSAFNRGEVDGDDLRAWLNRLFWDAETPGRMLAAPRWRLMFQAAGFTVNGLPAPRPSAPLRLFRSAAAGFERGLAWTPTIELARHHGERWEAVAPQVLLTAVVAPEVLLAERRAVSRRGEVVLSEFVVDARELDIERVA